MHFCVKKSKYWRKLFFLTQTFLVRKSDRLYVEGCFHVVQSSHPDFIWLTGAVRDLSRREQAFDTNIRKFCSLCREYVSKRDPVYCYSFSSLPMWSKKSTRACAFHGFSHACVRDEVINVISCSFLSRGRGVFHVILVSSGFDIQDSIFVTQDSGFKLRVQDSNNFDDNSMRDI